MSGEHLQEQCSSGIPFLDRTSINWTNLFSFSVLLLVSFHKMSFSSVSHLVHEVFISG